MKFFKFMIFLLAVIGVISIYNFYYQNNHENEYPVEKSAIAEKPKKEASANAPKLNSGEKKTKTYSPDKDVILVPSTPAQRNIKPGVEIYMGSDEYPEIEEIATEAIKFTGKCIKENLEKTMGESLEGEWLNTVIEDCRETRQYFVQRQYVRAYWGIAEDQWQIAHCFDIGCGNGAIPPNKLLACVWYIVLASSGHLDDRATSYATMMRETCKRLYQPEIRTATIAAEKILVRIAINKSLYSLNKVDTCRWHRGKCK